MQKIWNKDLIRILISILLFILALFIKISPYHLILLILSYIIISYEIYWKAFKNIKKKEIFDENFLMILATIGAFFIGSYEEAVMVMLLFEIGEYFSDLAVENSKRSITKLMDLRSDTVNLKTEDKIEVVDIKKVKEKDIFVVKPGEKIPLDGIIIDGKSSVDTSSLTGESIPRTVRKEDQVLSGYVNKDSVLTIKATSVYETSTATRIIEMIENSNDKKTDTEKFITKFAKIYTPVVVLGAILLVIIPVLLGQEFELWFQRSLVFLVTSCPCALVISVPLSYFCGIGKSSQEGILIKGSTVLDQLNSLKTLVFDKTGTITEGVFEVTKITPIKLTEEELLEIAAYSEVYSTHPIAKSIQKKYQKKIDEKKITNYKEISGMGISCTYQNEKILIGNKKLMDQEKIKVKEIDSMGTVIYLSKNKEYQGYIEISDKVKKNSYRLTEELKALGDYHTIILSGDNEQIVKKVAKDVKIDDYYSSLLPIDKVEKIKELKKEGTLLFVGDGINDAPAMKTADIGVAMGGIGSDATIEASNMVLMRDNIVKIAEAIKIAKKTQNKVRFNISFALSVKFVILLLGIFGISTIWMAVFADVGVTFLAILNALLIMRK